MKTLFKNYLRAKAPLKLSVFLLFIIFIVGSCKDKSLEGEPNPTEISKPTKDYDTNISLKWADLTLKLLKNTPGHTPPVVSRALGYISLTMYEAGVNGMPEYQSLVGQLNGFSTLPKPNQNLKYNWALAINAAEHQIIKDFFVTASDANKKLVDSLKNALESELVKSNNEATEIVNRSNEFGVSIAKAIWEYSKTDGGHEGYKRNFPTDYVIPKGICFWEITENKQRPLQPYWG